jgi:enoyl-CoA hydratase/carnithine racemase
MKLSFQEVCSKAG